MSPIFREAFYRKSLTDKPRRPAGKLTTLRISCTRVNVDLLNNERRAKKPERWQALARRVRLMRRVSLGQTKNELAIL